MCTSLCVHRQGNQLRLQQSKDHHVLQSAPAALRSFHLLQDLPAGHLDRHHGLAFHRPPHLLETAGLLVHVILQTTSNSFTVACDNIKHLYST